MATLADLALPGYLDGIEPSAATSYGKRCLGWTLSTAGTLHGCRFVWAWFEVTEREPWRGEPLWLSAQRRTGESHARSSFTDRARDRLAAEILPGLAAGRFDQLWQAAHVQRAGRQSSEAVAAAARCRLEAAWWEQVAELAALLAAGLISFRAVPGTPIGQRPPTVEVVPRYRGDGPYREPVAAAFVDGEQVGWMTSSAELVPLDALLRADHP